MSTLYFRNKHLLLLSMSVIVVAGVSALITLPRQEDPRIVHRNPLIVTSFPGASAQRVETLISEKIEDVLQEVEEIKHIESTSRAGVSVVAIELRDHVEAGQNDAIFSEIRDKLSEAEQEFPGRAGQPMFDDKRAPVAFTLIVGVSWTHQSPPRMGILRRLSEDLADELRNVPGTELVRLYGAPEEEISVTVQPDQLAGLGLPLDEVSRRIEAADSKAPAGLLRDAAMDLRIEVAGELDSLERIGAIPLSDKFEDSVTRLSDVAHDVAQLTRAWRDPPEEIALADGHRTILVAARMGGGQRVDQWTESARQTVDNMQSRVGQGIGLDVVFNQNLYTTNRLAELAQNLFLGVLVVMVVVLLTMGWRASLVVGTAIPLVMAATIFGLQVVGGGLHQMAIFGMIIALGLLIDNAIVVVDEVRKLRLEGRSPIHAVRGAVSHLFVPLLASTLTTVLAFAPIPLLPGGAGDFVSMIGGSVIIAITSSFAISMTIIVALAGIAMSRQESSRLTSWWHHGWNAPRISRYYRAVLSWTVTRPWLALPLACSPALIGFACIPLLGSQFFPPVDRNMFHIQVWLPEQTSIEQTRGEVEAIEEWIRRYSEIERVDWMIGGSFPSVYYNQVMNQEDAAYYAQGMLTCYTATEVDRIIDQMQRQLDDRFPNAQILVREFGQGPPVDADVQIRLFGSDIPTLQRLGDTVRRHLQAHPQTLHTMVTMPRGQPKLWLAADEDKAQLAGFRLRDLSRQLHANFEGLTGGSVLEEREELPIRVRFNASHRNDLSAIASTNLVHREGDWVPLETLGRLQLKPSIAGVYHFNGQRCNVVQGHTRNDSLPIDVAYSVLGDLEAKGFTLPPGYRLQLGGAVEQDREAVKNLATFAPILIVLMIATLILAMRSVSMAVLLIAEAFMCVGLALLATWSYGLPFSFNSILGTLGLIGIGINDSIVVLAAIRANPAARAGDRQAIVEEVHGTTRHIISTSLTTSGGFLPLLLFIGGDFWPSLAIVLAGGVLGATMLSVLMIPPGYFVVSRIMGGFASRSVSYSA